VQAGKEWRAIQNKSANSTDYSYAAFCKSAKALGCAGYVVSFPG